MPKNLLHDIMPNEQRSIRRVPLRNSRRNEADRDFADDPILYESEGVVSDEVPAPSQLRRAVLWSVSIIFLALLGVALATSLAGATVTITAKTERVALNHEFTASRESGAKLRFEAIPVNEISELVIPATLGKQVSERASGTLIVYNNFSAKPQRLIKNTRFETKEGLIYRIGVSIIVPGKTEIGGRAVPGSVEAVVAADSPGDEYNIPLSDFTVPGFKSDPARFAGFYARSKTPMTGGFEGAVKTAPDKALLAARATLTDTLQKKVAKEKQGLVPPGYVLFPGAIAVRNESLPLIPRGGDQVAVREKMTGAAFVFKREDISRAIAESAAKSFTANVPVEIPDLGTIALEFKEMPSGDVPALKVVRFMLRGNATVVSLYDSEKLRTALAGQPKDDLVRILSSFPMIDRAELVIRPFWSRSFPKNPNQIVIDRTAADIAGEK